MCKSIFGGENQDDLHGLYIMTLGVIDECRQLGIGTKLLDQSFKQLQEMCPICTIAYLHVVDYNKSAINFYIKKNGFAMLKVEK